MLETQSKPTKPQWIVSCELRTALSLQHYSKAKAQAALAIKPNNSHNNLISIQARLIILAQENNLAPFETFPHMHSD